MSDIQEIMKEMDNLSDQMAVTLNEEQAESLIAQQQVVTCANACSGTGGGFACAASTNREIPFRCTLTIPEGFSFDHLVGLTNNPRIAFNLDCLTAFVEPCFCAAANGNLRFAIRVVGCISYIVNLRVNTAATGVCVAAVNRVGTPDIFVCCHDSVCVDTTVCFACIESQAFTQLGLIRNRLGTCGASGVNVQFDPVTPCPSTGTPVVAATVSGRFILPDCI